MKSFGLSLRSGLLGCVVALLVLSVVAVPLSGCTAADEQTAVNLVVTELPVALQLVPAIVQAVDAFGVTARGTQAQGVGATIQSKLQELQALATQFQQHATGPVFSQIVATVDDLVNTGDSALLDLASIKDPLRRAAATSALTAVDVVLHAIDGYLQAAESKTQVQASVQRRTLKLKQVSALWDKKEFEEARKREGLSSFEYRMWAAQESAAGF